MKTLIPVFLAVLILFAGCSTQRDPGTITKSDSVKRNSSDENKPSHKRMAPKQAAPLKLKGIEYSAPVSEMGYVSAKELSSGKVLWSKQVYKIEYDNKLERDVQDVFIDSLWVSGDVIMIHNEKDELYELNPETQNITKK